MMIKVFKNSFDYIDFMTSGEIKQNEVICSNFVPSAFFPKDVIDYFFDKKEHIMNHKIAAEKLWKFGKLYLKELKKGKVRLAIELDAIKSFIETGIVNKETINFETTLATRRQAIGNILLYFENTDFLIDPIPYIFRLVPPDSIILDVDRNKTEQTIQGLYLKDQSAYDDFLSEFKRLTESSTVHLNKHILYEALIDAKDKLSSGIIPEMDLYIKKALTS